MQRIDDTHPSIHYTPAGAWHTGGVAAEYNSTTHGSTIVGAQMMFLFNGTQVEVYGTNYGHLGTVQSLDIFTLDGQDPVEWSVIPGKPAIHNQKMFSSPILPDGTHVLTMQVTVNNSDTFIDYLEFMPSPSQQMSSSLPPPSSSTTSSEAGGTSGLSSSPISPGAAAGIAVSATVVVMSLLGIMIWQYLKRRRRMISTTPSLCKEPAITPFYSIPVYTMPAASSDMSGAMTDSTSEAVLEVSPQYYQVEKRVNYDNYPFSVHQSLS